MDLPLPWYALAVATTVLNGAALGFLAWREQHIALKQWAAAWLAWGLAVIPLVALGSPDAHPLAAIFCGVLWVGSALSFLRGAHALAGQIIAPAWYLFAGVCVVVALVLGVGPHGPVGMVPLVIFQSVGLLSTGVVIIRSNRGRTGAWLCGLAMIGLGLHILNAPLAAKNPTLFEWGFVLAIALQVLAAFGMLMLYYEHARAHLLDTQRALEETRRIEALGRVAGGVAHDFNNMLMVMRGHVDMIGASGTDWEGIGESLEAIDHAVERATRLTGQLLAFGRRSVIQREAVDAEDVLRSTLDLLKKVIPEDIDLSLRCGEGPFVASLDRALLEQIILNLVTNARDAITGQGKIQVEIERRDQPKPEIVIRVIDDGEGMDAAHAARIFEPFYTSKPVGRGTGLGLASVQGAVSQLGGTLHVRSKPGSGSTFEVVLPWVPATKADAQAHAAATVRPLDILVVDDDESVRATTAQMLELDRHRVEHAHDGREALERLENRSYDLVLSDVVMPRMGGVELAAEVSKRWPRTAVLLTSGYPHNIEPGAIRASFLPKPFTRVDLLGLVARLTALPQHADPG